MDVPYDPDARVTVDICPARLITPDVLDVFAAYRMADGRLSVSEQAELPTPYIEAWMLVHHHTSAATAHRMKTNE